MPGVIPNRPEVSQLREKIKSLQDRDWTSAAVKQEFGSLNFVQAVPLLTAGGELIAAIAKIDLNALPNQRIANVNNILDNYQGVFNRIAGFDITQQNARNTRDQIVNQLYDSYNQLFDHLSGPLGVWAATGTDAASIKEELRQELKPTLTESETQYRAALSEIQSANQDAAQALAAIREAAGKSGVTAHAKVFSEQAQEHLEASKTWIKLTIGALVAIVAWGLVVIFFFPIQPNATGGVIAQEIFTRIIVVTGISYALVWCARNYSANRHNYILNKHRQNSLTTFEAFVKAADDVDTKNAVLIQATTSIFSAQSTGYGGKDAEVEQPSKILEIFKSAKGV